NRGCCGDTTPATQSQKARPVCCASTYDARDTLTRAASPRSRIPELARVGHTAGYGYTGKRIRIEWNSQRSRGAMSMLRQQFRASRATANPTRRDFLRAGASGALALSVGRASFAGSALTQDRALILLMLVGGPSQLDTIDPKPDAPSEIRGP